MPSPGACRSGRERSTRTSRTSGASSACGPARRSPPGSLPRHDSTAWVIHRMPGRHILEQAGTSRAGIRSSLDGRPWPGRPTVDRMPILTVPYRFRGPSRSANGGYMCGRVAGYVDGAATVTLHRPPPLDTPMTVDPDGGGSVRVWHDGVLVAEASSANGDGAELPMPDVVSIGEA